MFSHVKLLRRRLRALSPTRLLISTFGLLMVVAGVAFAVAPTGLQNGSFEQDLTGWDASIVRGDVYSGGTPEPATCTEPNGVCVVGTDHFMVRDDEYSDSFHEETVTPVDGTKMVRLGGPFTSSDVRQPIEQYRLQQTFSVDPSHPVLELNYNVFTWDYTGYDDLFFKVTLTDENGDTITNERQGSFGSGVSLKSTGWRPTHIDLTGYEGQEVHLKIVSGGTRDTLFGFWSYIDAGMVAEPPVGKPEPQQVNYPPSAGGGEVPIDSYDDENSGQTWLTIPAAAPSKFPNGCMPLTLNVPIDAGGGTVSNAGLLVDPKGAGANLTVPLDDADGNGIWSGQIPCVTTSDLYVTYSLTENGNTQSFSVPIGGLVLVDPAGVVYDKQKFDAAKASGKTDDEARAAAAIAGAQVRLQRCTSATADCANVLSGDPGIAPHANPEVTGDDGMYQWDVSAGFYRVIVTKSGYDSVTSPILSIPPPVTNAHIAMTKPSGNDGDGGGGGGDDGAGGGGDNGNGSNQGNPGPAVQQPSPQPSTPQGGGTPPKKGCDGLTGAKRKKCLRAQKLKSDLAKCKKLKGKKRAACEKKVRALAKCDKLSGKKRAACRKRASSPGKKH